jgi:hypothetical protein
VRIRHLMCLSLLLSGSQWVAMAQTAPPGWTSQQLEGGMLYQPSDLPQGSAFTVWVPPPSSVDSSAGSPPFTSLKRDGLRGIDVAGLRQQCGDEEVAKNGSITQTCRLLGGPQTLTVQYVMLPVRQSRIHWLRVMAGGSPALLERYQDGFRQLLKQSLDRWAEASPAAPASPASPASPARERVAAPAKPPTRAEDVARAIRAEPGKGVPASQIDTVLFTWAQIYRVTGLEYVETIYLLMKDGSAFKGLTLAPEDFDAEASRRLQPNLWKRWRKTADTYQVKGDSDASWDTLKGGPAVPGASGQRLAQTFTHHWSVSYGGAGGGAGSSSIVFSQHGTFEEIGRSIVGTGVLQAVNGASAGAVSTRDRTGSAASSSVSATGGLQTDPTVIAGGSTSRRANGADYTGRYRIDGWAIELHRDNGTAERRLFLFTNSKRNAVNIGGTWYSADKP